MTKFLAFICLRRWIGKCRITVRIRCNLCKGY